ncbi:hypothetical protein C0992_006812 [Termitomyces sp. T32_za158]|nr:hypothetical protein C0992_006812 [Termitomyces sp. T32_za158]
MFGSTHKDDETPTSRDCESLNPTLTGFDASGFPSLHSQDTLQSVETNLSMMKLLKELPSAALEIQSELPSTIVFPSTSSNTVVTELAIDPYASPFHSNLWAHSPASAPSNLPLSVSPALSKALSVALEMSPVVNTAEDIAGIASNVFSLNKVRATSVNEDNPADITSDSLPSKLPLGDLPKIGGKSVVGEAFHKSFNEMSPSSPLSTKLSTVTSSPLAPLISLVELMDEATPLLQSAKRIPWSQVSILLFLQMVGPLTTHVVSPFTSEACSCSLRNVFLPHLPRNISSFAVLLALILGPMNS